jgi:hypothetical protein
VLLQLLQWSLPAWFFLASFPRPVWPLAPICPQQRDQYSFIVPRNAAEWYCFFNQFPGMKSKALNAPKNQLCFCEFYHNTNRPSGF